MQPTVIQHVLSSLKALGVTDVFGVPGDYAFPINDAVSEDRGLNWVANCNELNAAYAADGYARIKGFAAVSTTFGVGELSAINGIAGAYAECLPVFHLVGMPRTKTQEAKLPVHHSLGNGAFDAFYKMAEPVVCAQAIMTPENCARETERLIAAARYHRRPVYMGFPEDYARTPIAGAAVAEAAAKSDPAQLRTAIRAIADAIARSRTACILPGIFVVRWGCRQEALELLNACGLPYATMLMDKTVFDETHPAYMGMYVGHLMNPEVQEFVEGCDCVLNLGTVHSDVNTGIFTARIDPSRSISVNHHDVRVGSAAFENVEMRDVLRALAEFLPRRTDIRGPRVKGLGAPAGSANDAIGADALFPRWERFVRRGDIVVTDTGVASMGLAFAQMPEGVTYLNEALWGSIGWATPAAFGAAVADPGRRTILITGEGSHQLTAQEISQFPRRGLKPVIFVLNNYGYLTERLFCTDGSAPYNDVAQWNYAALPAALGCKGWLAAKAATCAELDQAMSRAETCGTGAYIEVITDTYAAPPLPGKMRTYIAEMARPSGAGK